MSTGSSPLIAETHAARRLLFAGNPPAALNLVAAYDAPFATLSLVRGECHYALGEWGDAVREFEEALRLSPNSPRAEILLQLSSDMVELSKSARPASTIEQLLGVSHGEEDISAFPKAPIAIEAEEAPPTEGTVSDEMGLVSETLADLLIRQGKLDEARKVYIQLSRLNPNNYEYFRDRIQKLDNNH